MCAIRYSSYKQEFLRLSFGVFQVDDEEFEVHFHLENGECKTVGEVAEYCWDEGHYSRPDRLQNGMLLVLAHFVVVDKRHKPLQALHDSLSTLHI